MRLGVVIVNEKFLDRHNSGMIEKTKYTSYISNLGLFLKQVITKLTFTLVIAFFINIILELGFVPGFRFNVVLLDSDTETNSTSNAPATTSTSNTPDATSTSNVSDTIPAFNALTLDTATLNTATLNTAALNTSTLDTPTLNTPTLDTPTLDTPTLDAPMLDAPMLDAPDTIPTPNALDTTTARGRARYLAALGPLPPIDPADIERSNSRLRALNAERSRVRLRAQRSASRLRRLGNLIDKDTRVSKPSPRPRGE